AILDHTIAYLVNLITHAIAWLGYPGIVLTMMLESSLVPIPSGLVMPFAGYLASTGRFHLIWAALATGLPRRKRENNLPLAAWPLRWTMVQLLLARACLGSEAPRFGLCA